MFMTKSSAVIPRFNRGIQKNTNTKAEIPASARMTSEVAKNTISSDKNTASEKSLEEKKEEFGGPKGLEPTRYGDWEVNGRVSDF